MVSTAVQLFTVCEADESLTAIVDRVEDAGYDGVEFNEEWFPLRTSSDDEIHTAPSLESRSIDAAGTQVPLDRLETRFDDVLAAYDALSCRDFVVPSVDEACFSTRAAVVDTATRLTAMAARLAEVGARLHYHNHDFEFSTVDGRSAYELLVEEVDGVRFELDVGWAAAAGEDPAALLERHAHLIDLVHLKDVNLDTATPAEIGCGDVDLEACVDAARAADVDWLIYEYDWPEDPFASLTRGGEWLTQRVR